MKWREYANTEKLKLFISPDGFEKRYDIDKFTLPVGAATWLKGYYQKLDEDHESTASPELKAVYEQVQQLESKLNLDRPSFSAFQIAHLLSFVEAPHTSIFHLDLPQELSHALIWADIYFIEQVDGAILTGEFTSEDIYPWEESPAYRSESFTEIQRAVKAYQERRQKFDADTEENR